ncbi:N-acetylmuramoyl-L-alanine amidase [Deinococcus radiomollis]|uniref:N-acetylmuramoyl-L-alanine amidase family protein n=1 Tax=Deinococcus radiomollis TaxID=468916 RepID=UPI0038915988
MQRKPSAGASADVLASGGSKSHAVRPAAFRKAALLGLLGLMGLAGAQFTYTQLSLVGKSAQGISLYGKEYVGSSTLSRLVQVSEAGGIARVEGLGHVLLLPIDDDQQRATTAFNTVQLDSVRLKAATATRQGEKLLLPLTTVAQGLGAQYTPGQFSLAPAALSGVSSLAGKESDRVVLTLNRAVTVREELLGNALRLTLTGASASTQNYTTRGVFIPRVQVTAGSGGARVTLPLPAGSGYRVYTVQDAAGSRVMLDVGPGVPFNVPALLAQVRKPLIVLDPASLPTGSLIGSPGVSRDVTLEVARSAAELLSKAGWQVKLTRDTANAPQLAAREDLARQSDVFVSLDLGRFPGMARSGVTLYEFSGQAPAQIVNAYRQAQGEPLVGQVVSELSRSRTLSNLLRGELKSDGLSAGQQPQSRLLVLGEAPKAALLLELGWAQSQADQQRLADGAKTTQMATALARAVATYLTARANAGQS